MRTGNPALNSSTFDVPRDSGAVMTLDGAVFKSGVLIILCIAAASLSWSWAVDNPESLRGVWIGAMIGGLVLALITIFAKRAAPFTAPLYAIVEGVFLGVVSMAYNHVYNGIVMSAVLGTIGVFMTMLVLYATRIIKATENFKLGVVAATGGIFLMYIATWIFSMFGIQVPYVHEGGPIGIGISVVVIIVAALNLVLDFDFIEKGAEHRAPKYMEWYAAFGLLLTLVWLYLEMLRLLAKARR